MDSEYFNTWSPNMSYILGYAMADRKKEKFFKVKTGVRSNVK